MFSIDLIINQYYDVMNKVITNKSNGLIMSADFEAAFDSVSWSFLLRAMSKTKFAQCNSEVNIA